MDSVLLASGRADWGTPPALFQRLNSVFDFQIDPCASALNHTCDRYYTPADDGLAQSWHGLRVYMNPPYIQTKAWMAKAYAESRAGAIVVCLVAARTDTKAFQDYAWQAAELWFLRGRVTFEVPGSKGEPAPFPSMIAIFLQGGEAAAHTPRIKRWDHRNEPPPVSPLVEILLQAHRRAA